MRKPHLIAWSRMQWKTTTGEERDSRRPRDESCVQNVVLGEPSNQGRKSLTVHRRLTNPPQDAGGIKKKRKIVDRQGRRKEPRQSAVRGREKILPWRRSRFLASRERKKIKRTREDEEVHLHQAWHEDQRAQKRTSKIKFGRDRRARRSIKTEKKAVAWKKSGREKERQARRHRNHREGSQEPTSVQGEPSKKEEWAGGDRLHDGVRTTAKEGAEGGNYKR